MLLEPLIAAILNVKAENNASGDLYLQTGDSSGAGNTGVIHLAPGNVSGGQRGVISLEGQTNPATTNTYQLGDTGKQFSAVWAAALSADSTLSLSAGAALSIDAALTLALSTEDQSGVTSSPITLKAGDSDDHAGGSINITAGSNTAAAGANHAGDITLTSGSVADAATTGRAGEIVLSGGTTAGNNFGGNIRLLPDHVEVH